MKQFRVGVIGYGWSANAIIQAIDAGPQGQVTKICSSRASSAAELSVRYGNPIETYTDYAAMLAAPDLNAVAITGYHHVHKDQVIAAARAGKHVICEKPLALGLADLREVEHVVRTTGVHLCVCLEVRFSAQFRAVKSLLDRGLLGQLHYGEVDYYHGIGPWYTPFTWYRKAEEGVSSLLLAGCHAMDILLLCMGGDVEEVFSYATRSANPAFATYEYPLDQRHPAPLSERQSRQGGLGGRLFPALLFPHAPGGQRGIAAGRQVPLEPDRRAQSPAVVQAVVSTSRFGRRGRPSVSAGVRGVFRVVGRGAQMPLMGLADAVRTHEVMFAADLSWQQKRPVKLAEILE